MAWTDKEAVIGWLCRGEVIQNGEQIPQPQADGVDALNLVSAVCLLMAGCLKARSVPLPESEALP
jgi:hypothetical protein